MGIQINGQTDTISAVDGTMTFPGTVTYEDVSRVNVTGVSTFAANVHVSDSIAHLGDIDTSIRFPAADTFTVETAGSERLRIDSSGNIGIGTDSPDRSLHIANTVPAIRFEDTNNSNALLTISGSAGDCRIQIDPTSAYASSRFSVDIDGEERARIDSSGRLLVGISTARTNFYYSTIARTPGLQYEASGSNTALSVLRTNGLAALYLANAGTITADGGIGGLNFVGNDGTNLRSFAKIEAEADGAVSTADVPGRLVFSTNGGSPDTSSTERMRIDNTGNVFVGGLTGYLVAEYNDGISNGENLTITFAGASNSHRGQNIFQITYCNHTNNSANLYAASFIVNIRDSATTGYSLSITDFQSIYNVNSTVGAIGDLTFVDNGDGTATLALPNKVGAGGNSGNTTARVTIQRLCSGFGLAMYPTQAVAV